MRRTARGVDAFLAQGLEGRHVGVGGCGLRVGCLVACRCMGQLAFAHRIEHPSIHAVTPIRPDIFAVIDQYATWVHLCYYICLTFEPNARNRRGRRPTT